MITPAKRFQGWIETLSEAWRDRLRGWMASWFMNGFERLFDFFEPSLREEIRPSIQRLLEIEELPDDQRAILTAAIEAPGAIQFTAILPYLIGGMFGLAMGSIAPTSRIGSYQIDKLLHSFRLDPGIITSIWLRDKPTYEKLWDDLRDQGWDESRIEVAKELSKIIPPLAHMVRFADFAAFDPEVIAKWREFYDAPSWIAEPFSLLGITGEWANKYWFSHWIQPGRFELGEMHRRGLIDDDAVKLAYRTMGYSPFWQDLLLELVKAVPTRVDVRRWWDMRTIDEARLREIYHAQGYYGKDLEDYVLWTKVYVAFPDLIARYKNGWITEEEAKTELVATGLKEPRLTELWETKFKTAQPERVEGERTATATEIMKAVKKEYITWGEGIERLTRMGYSPNEADFKLKVYVGVAEGSPETYMEFVDITERYRQAMGLEAKIPPQELIEADKALRKAKDELIQAEEKGLKDEKLAPYLKAVSDAEYRFRQLYIQWKGS